MEGQSSKISYVSNRVSDFFFVAVVNTFKQASWVSNLQSEYSSSIKELGEISLSDKPSNCVWGTSHRPD